MQPALSIVIFNVTMGFGFGWVAVGLGLHESALAPFADPQQIRWLGGLGLAAISAGLAASTGHLANPKNFWRAFVRVRTSWLSREAVLALVFYPLMLLYLLAAPGSNAARWLGLACVLTALLTLFATGMIYACLRTIRQWYTPLTPINYLLMSLGLGAIAAAAQHALAGDSETVPVVRVALFLLMGGFIGKLCYFLQIGLPARTGINTATGFRMARVRLLDLGGSGRNFLTDEFDYQVSGAWLLILKLLTLAVGFLIPGVLLLTANSWTLMLLALVLAYAGALLERWLFLAEAEHVVRLYQGQQQV